MAKTPTSNMIPSNVIPRRDNGEVFIEEDFAKYHTCKKEENEKERQRERKIEGEKNTKRNSVDC